MIEKTTGAVGRALRAQWGRLMRPGATSRRLSNINEWPWEIIAIGMILLACALISAKLLALY